jgi:hypothetical protein
MPCFPQVQFEYCHTETATKRQGCPHSRFQQVFEKGKINNIIFLMGDLKNEESECVKWRSMDWIDLVQNRYRWQVLVAAVMNLSVP